MSSPDPTSSGQDELRTLIWNRLEFVRMNPDARETDLERYTNDIMKAVAHHTQEAVVRGALRARLDERHELRKLFDALRMQFGASAGSATGVTIQNDFGESWDFQIDRYALNDLLGRLNSKAALSTPQKNEGGDTLQKDGDASS